MKNKRIKFKGWDWTELMQLEQVAKNWPKLPEYFVHDEKSFLTEDDQKFSYQIKTYLGNIMWPVIGEPGNVTNKERKRAMKYVRKFLVTMSKTRDTAAPIYAGMAKVKNDFTLIQWVSYNLENLWT